MIAPAMKTRPQEALLYRDLAKQKAHISRQTDLSRLPRLDELAGESGQLNVELGFDLDPEGRSAIAGTIGGALELTCNRCAELMTHEFELRFRCIVVDSDQLAAELGGRTDVLLVEGDRISVEELIEDEILLSLPERLCRATPCEYAPGLEFPADEAQAQTTSDEPNPFDVLAQLKTNDEPG